ncbi:MAG: GlxA family transcriptional regulator [Actinomycetota bacterium]
MPPPVPRQVVIVTYSGAQALDVTGPHEVFAGANAWAGNERYQLRVVATSVGPVPTESGLRIDADPLTEEPIDTLIVAGGAGVQAARRDRALVGWLDHAARRSRRVASVCSGAFLLGEVGLLDGRRCTTHWARADQLAEAFPAAVVDPDPIYLHDGVWTSAGVTAGIDLALQLVADDEGTACAHTVAQWLVMFLRRPGGQSQFAAPVWNAPPSHDGIRVVVEAIHADPAGRHTLDDLARRASMSPRHFSRVFTLEMDASPGRYVERLRVDAARGRLEQGDESVDAVATACGFGTAETMRRAFLRQLGVAPAAYRDRFSHSVAATPAARSSRPVHPKLHRERA